MCLLESALWALRGQASGAEELMGYPDGSESASEWQYAESE